MGIDVVAQITANCLVFPWQKTGNKEEEGRQIVTVQYTETTAEK